MSNNQNTILCQILSGSMDEILVIFAKLNRDSRNLHMSVTQITAVVCGPRVITTRPRDIGDVRQFSEV